MEFSDEELSSFYQTGIKYPFSYHLQENEYLLVKNLKGEVIDYYCFQRGQLRRVKYPVISNKFFTVKPRNNQQILALDMLQDGTSKIKLLRGVYGSGKDHLMLNQALALIEAGQYEKIIYIRPNVTVANVPDIGFLKGTIDEKLEWTLAPFYDKVGGRDGVQMLIDKGQLETVPLLYIRGRSFEDSIIYVTEGQNMTTEIVKLLISRIGENSLLYINGDTHQVDKKVYEQDNGINKMIEKLSGNKLFGYVYLPITERGEVANLANLLDE